MEVGDISEDGYTTPKGQIPESSGTPQPPPKKKLASSLSLFLSAIPLVCSFQITWSRMEVGETSDDGCTTPKGQILPTSVTPPPPKKKPARGKKHTPTNLCYKNNDLRDLGKSSLKFFHGLAPIYFRICRFIMMHTALSVRVHFGKL
ncbi:hypothetical protein FH972_005460 [Carpinus fangiana]|uniref:Uncharacterized protein n=1 Tax=Carpinus fangiana TaxID=176857 RepID=A0A5N6QSU1_9ROSI|nr:hypothetical protein FH972_005460 [Carpinus fangiana]